MCGRYVSVVERADLLELYNATDGPELEPSWNVAPTDAVYGVLERTPRGRDEPQRQLRALRWGLVPSWAKDVSIGSRLINARVETLASKPAFRSAYTRRRLVLPAAGYYEWQPIEDGRRVRKQPYYIHPGDVSDTLAFAGLYELWPDPSKDEDDPDRWLWSATIITTDATGPLGEIHDRTPLILPRDRIDAWLDPSLTDPERIHALLTDIHIDGLQARPVSPEVNKVANDGAQLIAALPEAADQPIPLTIGG